MTNIKKINYLIAMFKEIKKRLEGLMLKKFI